MKHLFTPNPMIISCVTIAIFLMIIPCVVTLSFNYTTFSTNDHDITYEKAYPAYGVIQLTANQKDLSALGSRGRATYSKPLNLWDKASRNITDFTTHFSFVINSQNKSQSGDGMTFFLAHLDWLDPIDVLTGGAGLGLINDTLHSTSKFVAVEFDIFKNAWDPEGSHVGIDLNCMKSVTTSPWFSSIKDGKHNEAWISYDSQSKNLSVVFTGYKGNLKVEQNLNYIVDLREHLPENVTFGFSAATGAVEALHSIHSWDFTSNLEITEIGITNSGRMVPEPAPQIWARPGADPTFSTERKSKNLVVIGSIIGLSVLVIVLGLFLYFFRKTRARRDYEGDNMTELSEFEEGSGPKRFSYTDLATATSNFAEEKKLGEGGFGGVYKGYIREHHYYIAVKRVSKESNQGVKEYASEVKIISRLRHRNLVQLIGWCHEKKELLLVYEFMCNGSLDIHLFKEKSLLTWEMRFKIAKGIASALLYLHEEWEQCVVHRDIKASNIMLDSSFNAKLGDFGLARLVDHGKGSQTTVLAGTMGYMAPESLITGKASKETDVYSFGVVALEIACGRKPIEGKAQKNEVNLVEWVWSLYGTGKLLEAADPKLSFHFNQKEIEYLMIIGLWCAHPDNNARPSIKQASHVLNFEAPLPELPPRMPVPTYWTPSVTSLLSPNETQVSRNSQVPSSVYTTDSSFSTLSGTSSPSQSLLYAR